MQFTCCSQSDTPRVNGTCFLAFSVRVYKSSSAGIAWPLCFAFARIPPDDKRLAGDILHHWYQTTPEQSIPCSHPWSATTLTAIRARAMELLEEYLHEPLMICRRGTESRAPSDRRPVIPFSAASDGPHLNWGPNSGRQPLISIIDLILHRHRCPRPTSKRRCRHTPKSWDAEKQPIHLFQFLIWQNVRHLHSSPAYPSTPLASSPFPAPQPIYPPSAVPLHHITHHRCRRTRKRKGGYAAAGQYTTPPNLCLFASSRSGPRDMSCWVMQQ